MALVDLTFIKPIVWLLRTVLLTFYPVWPEGSDNGHY